MGGTPEAAERTSGRRGRWRARMAVGVAALALVAACMGADPRAGARHRWWSGLGPVLPHDTFPADCTLCHEGSGWNQLRADFTFDHGEQTGVALHGEHEQAQCLRCHNDRGPVDVFAARGCGGCHEDLHQGDLGNDCARCHGESSWHELDGVALHLRTRFPLSGAHARVACHQCHPGASVGNFMPADPSCVTCHRADLARAANPPHLALGFVDRCDRCHLPTNWHAAELK